MNNYLVTVHPARIEIDAYYPPENKSPDYVAIVDGNEHRYFMRKNPGDKISNATFDTAIQAIFYHGKNAGNIVRWKPVFKPDTRQQKEISPKQKTLF